MESARGILFIIPIPKFLNWCCDRWRRRRRRQSRRFSSHQVWRPHPREGRARWLQPRHPAQPGPGTGGANQRHHQHIRLHHGLNIRENHGDNMRNSAQLLWKETQFHICFSLSPAQFLWTPPGRTQGSTFPLTSHLIPEGCCECNSWQRTPALSPRIFVLQELAPRVAWSHLVPGASHHQRQEDRVERGGDAWKVSESPPRKHAKLLGQVIADTHWTGLPAKKHKRMVFFRILATIACPLDLRNFPHDVQTCKIRILYSKLFF